MKKKRLSSSDPDLFRLIVVTLLIFVAMTALKPDKFISKANFSSMCYQIPEIGLYTLSMMLILVTGQTDISAVAIGNLCTITGITIMSQAGKTGSTGAAAWGYILLALLVMLAIGVVCGLINGLTVTYFKVPTMLVTMATSSIFRGISVVATEGNALTGAPHELTYFGNHGFLGIAYAMWYFLIIFLVITFLMNKTKFGVELRFIGSNEKASEYAGINVRSTLLRAYVCSGVIAALTAFEIIARTDAAKYDYGGSYVNQALLACVLGATNPDGGYVRMACIALGLASVQFLSSGFNLLRLGGNVKQFAWGALLVFVVCFDVLNRELRRKKAIREVTKKHSS